MVRVTGQGRRATAIFMGLAVGGSALSSTGCGLSSAPGDQGVDFAKAAKHSGAGAATGTADAAAANYTEMPTPPPDARYTIYCQAYSGSDHQQVARQSRDLLVQHTPLKNWYVVHSAQDSTLYYGFYRTVDRRDLHDGAEGQRAIDDLDAIRTLHDSTGRRLFSASNPVPIDSPDPAANPAWDITRSGGFWSLEIASFKDTPDRKLRAVEAVADARKQGIPAYYYHGPHASSVCIGAWPEAAAAALSVGDQNNDPNKTLYVTQNQLSPDYRQKLGDDVQTAAPRVEPVDPSMIAAIGQYSEHAVNGNVMMKADVHGNPTSVPAQHSFLFQIPKAEDLASIAATDGGATIPVAAGQRAADGTGDVPSGAIAAPSPAGSGALRSLGE